MSRRFARATAAWAMLATALALTTVGESGCSVFRKELVFSRDDLQAKLGGQFPLEKNKRLMKFRFSEPELLLVPDSERIGMRIAVEAKIPGVSSVKGVMEADGEIEYHPETGQFAIARGHLVDLDMKGMPKRGAKTFEEIAATVVKKHLSRITVYELDQEDFKQSLAKLMLKSVQVRDEAIVVEVGL